MAGLAAECSPDLPALGPGSLAGSRPADKQCESHPANITRQTDFLQKTNIDVIVPRYEAPVSEDTQGAAP